MIIKECFLFMILFCVQASYLKIYNLCPYENYDDTNDTLCVRTLLTYYIHTFQNIHLLTQSSKTLKHIFKCTTPSIIEKTYLLIKANSFWTAGLGNRQRRRVGLQNIRSPLPRPSSATQGLWWWTLASWTRKIPISW